MNKDEQKLTKKERLMVIYISIYTVIIISMVIFVMANPDFIESMGNFMDSVTKAFGLFAN